MPMLGDDASDEDGLMTTQISESRPGLKKKSSVAKKAPLDSCLGVEGSPDNVLVVRGKGKCLVALKSDIVPAEVGSAIPLIQLAGATRESEDDGSSRHPFDHDEEACVLKKCWLCLVKVEFAQWQRDVGCFSVPNGMKFSWLLECPAQFQGQRLKSGSRP